MTQPHTFAYARSVAESMATAEVGQLLSPVPPDVLSSFHMEAEGCWFFFLNERLRTSVERPGTLVSVVYAVAKVGERTGFVYDFRPNMQQMQDYIDVWSLYALGKQEEARAAFQAFSKRYPEPPLATGA